MDLKSQIINKLKECDLINDEILSLKKKEQKIREEISQLKRLIERNNSHFIGKKALCTDYSNPAFKNIECICSSVKATDLFEVMPLFTRNGKKVYVDFYNWI